MYNDDDAVCVYLVTLVDSNELEWSGCGGHWLREGVYSLNCDNGRGVHLGDKLGSTHTVAR